MSDEYVVIQNYHNWRAGVVEQRHARWCMQYTDLWNVLNMPLLHLCPQRCLHDIIVEFALAKPLR